MNRRAVSAFEDAYDAASILDEAVPPIDLLRASENADVICSSDLPRAIATARRVAPDREIVITPLLREIRLEPPLWIPFALPISTWDALSHAQWSYRLWAKSRNAFVERADQATEWLEERASRARTTLVVTHAGFRRLLHARFRSRGWRSLHARQSYEHWSIWALER